MMSSNYGSRLNINSSRLHRIHKLRNRRIGIAQIEQFGVGDARVGHGQTAHLNGGDGRRCGGGGGRWRAGRRGGACWRGSSSGQRRRAGRGC